MALEQYNTREGVSQTGENEPCGVQQHGHDIKLASCHLDDYFNWDQVCPFENIPSSSITEAKFVARVNEFTTNMDSQILYACGPYSGETPDSLQRSIAAYIALAREARVPVVSYFCRLSHAEPPDNRTRETVELSALLYSMIRQLIELLPKELSLDAPDISAQRLSRLDGTLRTWEEATRLFEDLVTCVRLPLILFVIDGLSRLEDDFSEIAKVELRGLVKCLKHLADPRRAESRIVKILFITAGVSGTLYQELEEQDVIICEGSSPGGPCKLRRASQLLTF